MELNVNIWLKFYDLYYQSKNSGEGLRCSKNGMDIVRVCNVMYGGDYWCRFIFIYFSCSLCALREHTNMKGAYNSKVFRQIIYLLM